MTYTYEQAIADAPKHVKRRSDLPTKPGWKVCLDGGLAHKAGFKAALAAFEAKKEGS